MIQRHFKKLKSPVSLLLALILCTTFCTCGIVQAEGTKDPAKEKKDVYILFTSDVHCGIDQGFGYAGLQQVRDSLESKGYETLLVDDGDAIQGEPIGTLSEGEAIIDLMNTVRYDVAIPGNHEFDYGMDRFMELTKKADYPYISCNFNKKGKLVFDPYVIKEVAGMKIGFVGITTPQTLTGSTPAYFQNEKGEYVYGFMEDEDGSALYAAVQDAVDAVRAEGADYVYALAHTGNELICKPWDYESIVSHTSGIDVYLDGHSHDTDQVVLKNKDGKEVTRSAVGKKMANIGYSHISSDEGILETALLSWPNKQPLQEFFPVDNAAAKEFEEAKEELKEELEKVVASSSVDLIMEDPKQTTSEGQPIRVVRLCETNLGDLCADAYRDQGEADIAILNSGGIHASLKKGDITYGDLLNLMPYSNELCVVEVTGQQILDALEWGAKEVPLENAAFLQVSGLSYEIDTNIKSTCTQDKNAAFTGVAGERRVKNVKVGDKPIDPKKTYSLASHNYLLFDGGDGFTMLDGAKVLLDRAELDNHMLIDYITDTLGGTIGEEYAEPYGDGRIRIIE